MILNIIRQPILRMRGVPSLKYSNSTVYLLFFTAFIAFYLDAPIPFFSGVYIPSATSICLALSLGRFKDLRFAVLTVCLGLLFTPVGMLLADFDPPLQKVASGAAQTVFSLWLLLSVSSFLSQMDYKVLHRAACIAMIVFFSLCILERLGLTSSISSEFGKAVYKGSSGFLFYGNEEFSGNRDIALVGFNRPTVFSPEPSIAGIGAAVLGLLVARKSAKTAVVSLIFLAIAWFIIGSPIPLAAAILVGYGYALAYPKWKWGITLITLPVLAVVVPSLLYVRINELSDFNTLSETSVGIRLVMPYLVLVKSYLNGGFMGLGFGSHYDSHLMQAINPFRVSQFGTNAIALYFMYFGCVGSFILAGLVFRRLKSMGVWPNSSSYLMVILLMLGFVIGTFEACRMLALFSIILAFEKSRERSNKQSSMA